MSFNRVFSRKLVNNVTRLSSSRVLSTGPQSYRNACNVNGAVPSPVRCFNTLVSSPLQCRDCVKPVWFFRKFFHSKVIDLEGSSSSGEHDSDETEEDGPMSDFLSRFVWIMRGKLTEVYSDCDKETINGMLLIIVQKVVSEMEKGGVEQMLNTAVLPQSDNFSEDLWTVVREVSNMVSDDMEKAKKKEKMKAFLQDREVKEMYKFAGEIGIRGDMLRELRFKWAREKLEEAEFYESLEKLRDEEVKSQEAEKSETVDENTVESDFVVAEEVKPTVVSLPKRHGKIKYKIYGLDLSDPKWAEVADKIHETGEIMWPQVAKPISGKCKLVTEKILSLQEGDDVSPLLAEWMELLKPGRIDWISLLDRLKEKNMGLYYKVAELLLNVQSFQPSVRDYSKLIEAYANDNRLEDSERILMKMNEDGVIPDILTLSIMVHIHSKAGNIDRAKAAFGSLRKHGFIPDLKIFNSMIMAYVNARQPRNGELLITEMDTRGIKPTEEIYMALLRSFVQCKEINGAQRIINSMQFAGFQPNLESCRLLLQAYVDDPDQAIQQFDYMVNYGLKPDDQCIAYVITAYEKKNLLDKALELLLRLEKDGYELGVATYSVLVDWFGQMGLIDEAENLMGKIAELAEAPPVKVHVGLCEMYLEARDEKKALQALGVIETKKDQLGAWEFGRIIKALYRAGFAEDAKRVEQLMESQGIKAPDELRVSLMMKSHQNIAKERRLPTFRFQ